MMALEDMAASSFTTIGLEKREYCELIKKATAEIQAGVFLHYDMIVWVGRKQ